MSRTLRAKFVDFCLAVLLPLLIVGALQVNNHLYYDLHISYDMPQHLDNTYSIMRTGQMPQPPLTPYQYEAHQAPLFYVFSAWILLAGEQVSPDPFREYMPAVLFVLAMLWSLIVILAIRQGLRRLPPLLRGLVATVVLVFPMNTRMTVMYGNDVPVVLFATLGIFTLWFMCRSNRLTDRTLWVRAAALCGLAGAFKVNGIVPIGVYGVMLMLVGGIALWRQGGQIRWRSTLIVGAVSLLMMIPISLNLLNTVYYIGNPVGATTPQRPMWEVVGTNFFTSFDTSIFDMPFAFGNGERSYWSLQYVTLHSDYYNHWNSRAYESYPAELMMPMPHRVPMPIAHVADGKQLQFLAVPITGLMLFGWGYAVYRVMRFPRRAMLDGSVVVVVFAVVAQAAQWIRFSGHAEIRAAVIHARYQGFLYGFLFMVGVLTLYRLLAQRGKIARQLIWLLAGVLLAYIFIAVRFMWLPPL